MQARLSVRRLNPRHHSTRKATMTEHTSNNRDHLARRILACLVAAHAVSLAFAPALVAQQPVPISVSTPAGAVALSLDDAVRMAETQSETVRMARAGVQRSEGQRLQARSQFFPQIYGSGGYTRTLKSQYQGFGGEAEPDTSTKPAPPEPPCDAYLRDANASVADRLAGLEQASRCGAGIDPFASFSSLPFGQANQYQIGVSVTQNLFSGGRVGAQNAAAAAGRRSAEVELTAQRAQIILTSRRPTTMPHSPTASYRSPTHRSRRRRTSCARCNSTRTSATSPSSSCSARR